MNLQLNAFQTHLHINVIFVINHLEAAATFSDKNNVLSYFLLFKLKKGEARIMSKLYVHFAGIRASKF